MTREEIKNTPELVDFMLDKCILADSRTKVHKRLEEVCNLAIKALEQEPCEDCVSRQAILSMQYRIDDSATLSTRDVVNVEDIEDLLSVTPKPKTAHWIYKKELDSSVCSACGSRCPCDNFGPIETNYCPDCGAKMEKINDKRIWMWAESEEKQ